MKIAVVFSTQLRTIENTTENLINFFGDLFTEIDFFCHTWDISYNSNKTSGIIRHDDPTQTILEEYNKLINEPHIVDNFIKNFNPKKMVVEKFLDYQLRNYNSGKKDFQMWYSIWAGNELKRKYEIENEFTYDIVIKVRGDLFFWNERKLKNDIDYFLSLEKNSILRLEDFYYLTTSKNMDLLCDYGNNEKEIYIQYDSLPWGHVPYIESLGIELVKPPFNNGVFDIGGLFRNEARHLNLKDNFNEIFNIYKTYYD